MAVSQEFQTDVDTIYQLLTDPEFLVERSGALGEEHCECEVEEYEDETVITLERRVKRELPSFLAKMFNPVQTLKMKETWRPSGDSWEGDLEIQVAGQPVVIRGEFTLKSSKKGCVYSVSHSCKAKIPLVGGKVEKFILSQTGDGAKDELAFVSKKIA